MHAVRDLEKMLLESLRATKLLPAIAGFSRFGRICRALTTGVLLIALAGFACAMAFKRGLLMQGCRPSPLLTNVVIRPAVTAGAAEAASPPTPSGPNGRLPAHTLR